MNLRQVEIFAMVMRSGSATRAADLLDVSQPAISRSIAELEASLGFALFLRVKNRLIPTPEAKQFFEDVEASFRGLDTLRTSAANIRDHGTGSLRIASLAAMGTSVVPQAIARFRKTHPDTRVTLHVCASREVRDLVASGQFDLGLAADEIDITGIDYRKFSSHSALCAIPRGHPLSDLETITPRDLNGVDFVAFVAEDRARQRLETILDAENVRLNIVTETIYGATLCALVAAGVGVGLVSPYAAQGLDLSAVVLRRFEPSIQVRSLLVLPADHPPSQLVRGMISALMASR